MRDRPKSKVVGRLVLVGVVISACAGSSPEAMLVERFFAASRLDDASALSDFARVALSPRAGTVQRFTIADVHSTGERTEDVAVDAQLRTPSGTVQPRRMVITLERASDGRLTIVALH